MRNRNHDTCLLQARLIARGLSTIRLPGGAVMAYASGSNKTLAFAGTIPQGTTFEGAALSLKLNAAWVLLNEAGIQTPPWKIFLARAVKSAGRYAEGLGFPLIVSGIKGEHLVVVRDHNDLIAAMHKLGKERSLKRLIVRKHVDGNEVKVLVLGDEALSFNVDSAIERDLEVERVAVQSKAAIPGLALAEVRMTLGEPADAQGTRSVAMITGFSPAPNLRDYATSERGIVKLADKLIEAQANNVGIALNCPSEETNASLTIAGTVDSSIFSRLMRPLLAEVKCKENSAPEILTQESVRFDVTGPPESMAQVSIDALQGLGPERNRAHMITIENRRGAL